MASIDASTDYDTITEKGIAWLLATFVRGTVTPFPPNIREAWVKIFAGADNSRDEVLANSTREATRAEALYVSLATGPGGGNGSAPTQSTYLGYEGLLSANDVSRALELTA